MSDPMHKSGQTSGATPPPAESSRERSGPGPLLWILLLLAIIAVAWYFSGRRGAVETPPEAVPPIGEVTTEPSESPVSTSPATREASRERQPERRTVPADRDARPLNQLPPTYPSAALRAREEGTVVVRAQVDAAGKVTDVELADRSRSRDLDRAALDAVRDWTFEPAIRDGKPVATTVQVPVDFRLDTQ